MKSSLARIVQLGFLPIIVVAVFAITFKTQGPAETSLTVPQDTECLGPDVLTNALTQLSDSYDEAQKARVIFLRAAGQSRILPRLSVANPSGPDNLIGPNYF